MLAAAFKTGPTSLFSDGNNELCGSAPAPCVIFQTTRDSGVTWSRHVVPVPATATGPMVAADPSKPGHFAVAVGMNGNTQFDVYETRDSGQSWSKPVTVTEDASKRKSYPWLNYSPTGVPGLMWRSIQAPPSPPPAPSGPSAPGAAAGRLSFGNQQPLPYNIWAAVSRDGGATFSEPLKVSAADSPAGRPGAAGDDYSNIVLDRDYAYVGWPDWRPGERQGFFRAIPLSEFKAKR